MKIRIDQWTTGISALAKLYHASFTIALLTAVLHFTDGIQSQSAGQGILRSTTSEHLGILICIVGTLLSSGALVFFHRPSQPALLLAAIGFGALTAAAIALRAPQLNKLAASVYLLPHVPLLFMKVRSRTDAS